VGYLFKLKHDTQEENKLKIELIKKIFNSITPIFLAQWVMNYSAFYKVQYKVANMFYAHEISNVSLGLNGVNMQLSDLLSNAVNSCSKDRNKNEWNPPKPIKTLLNIGGECVKNIEKYRGSIEEILKTPFDNSDVIDNDDNMTLFYPFQEFIFQLIKNQETQGEQIKNRKIIYPDSDTIKNEYRLRPRIKSNIYRLERIFTNLLINAIKYSLDYTNIYVDAKLSPDKLFYIFTVSNYSFPILDYEKDLIFEAGYRGAYWESSDVKGMGYGLSMSKLFASKLGGRLKLITELISEKNIPFMLAYKSKRDGNLSDNLLQECNEELNRLTDKTIHEVINGKPKMDIKTHTYNNREINNPTVKITFTLSISYNEEEKYEEL